MDTLKKIAAGAAVVIFAPAVVVYGLMRMIIMSNIFGRLTASVLSAVFYWTAIILYKVDRVVRFFKKEK